MQHQESDFSKRLSDLELQRQAELSDLQTNFERKYQRFKEFQIDIEKINAELQEQNQHVRDQFRGKEEEIERLVQVREGLEKELGKEIEEKRLLERGCAEVLGRYEVLSYQKGILKRELKSALTQNMNT